MLMAQAHVAACRGTCNRLRVGAVLALNSRPISLGYNGAPSGHEHCGSNCNKDNPCKNTIHAEHNALWWAERHLGEIPFGCTLYVTDSPCLECAEKILSYPGIIRVVYDREYRITDGIDSLKRSIEVTQCHVDLAISVN